MNTNGRYTQLASYRERVRVVIQIDRNRQQLHNHNVVPRGYMGVELSAIIPGLVVTGNDVVPAVHVVYV